MFLFFLKKEYFIKSGYAMVEALIAITLLMIAIVAPMFLIMKIERKSDLLAIRAQAYYYANEGAELLINYKKSLEFYCLQNPSEDECALSDNVKKASFLMFLSRTPCVLGNSNFKECNLDIDKINFQEGVFDNSCDRSIFTSYLYDINTNLVSIKSKCNEDNTSLSGFTKINNKTQFTRYIIVEPLDEYKDRDGYSLYKSGAKIISTVCFDRGLCNNKVEVIKYVYQ